MNVAPDAVLICAELRAGTMRKTAHQNCQERAEHEGAKKLSFRASQALFRRSSSVAHGLHTTRVNAHHLLIYDASALTQFA